MEARKALKSDSSKLSLLIVVNVLIIYLCYHLFSLKSIGAGWGFFILSGTLALINLILNYFLFFGGADQKEIKLYLPFGLSKRNFILFKLVLILSAILFAIYLMMVVDY